MTRCETWSLKVGRGGIEPPTFRFSGGRSYRLSYLPSTLGISYCRTSETPRVGSRAAVALAVLTGLEPATSALTGRRAPRLLHRTWSGWNPVVPPTGFEPVLPP